MAPTSAASPATTPSRPACSSTASPQRAGFRKSNLIRLKWDLALSVSVARLVTTRCAQRRDPDRASASKATSPTPTSACFPGHLSVNDRLTLNLGFAPRTRASVLTTVRRHLAGRIGGVSGEAGTAARLRYDVAGDGRTRSKATGASTTHLKLELPQARSAARSAGVLLHARHAGLDDARSRRCRGLPGRLLRGPIDFRHRRTRSATRRSSATSADESAGSGVRRRARARKPLAVAPATSTSISSAR